MGINGLKNGIFKFSIINIALYLVRQFPFFYCSLKTEILIDMLAQKSAEVDALWRDNENLRKFINLSRLTKQRRKLHEFEKTAISSKRKRM